MENSFTALGIDPGTAIMGFGVVCLKNDTLIPADFGVIRTSSDLEDHARLKELYTSLKNIISKHKPDAVAVEDIFYFKNQKTIIQVGQARGVALLAASGSNKPVYEFTPLQIKQSVTGYGQADKKQVQEMVKMLTNLKEIPKPDDAADALAVAICCAHSRRTLEKQNN